MVGTGQFNVVDTAGYVGLPNEGVSLSSQRILGGCVTVCSLNNSIISELSFPARLLVGVHNSLQRN